MRFDWNDAKSEANEAKHGISFPDAVSLWDDPCMMVVTVRRNGEERKVALSRGLGACWFLVYTVDADLVRIISVRRATRNEEAAYDRENS